MRIRKIKCNATKEYGLSSDFYYADDGKYYKTKQIYEEYKINKVYFEKFYIKVLELLGYTDLRMVGSVGGFVRKKFKDSNIPKDELYNSLLENEEYIKNYLEK